MRQNVFLFKTTAIYTRFWAICCRMRCVLMLNTVRFDAKRKVFWCKTQCILVLNARHFGAKRSAKCCKMLDEKHKYTQQWYKQNLLNPSKTWLNRAK